MQDMELQPKGVGRRLQAAQKLLGKNGTGRIDEHANDGCRWYQFVQQLQPLRPHLDVQIGHAREVAARPVQAGDKSNLHRVDRYREHDRNCRSRCLCRHYRRSAASRY